MAANPIITGLPSGMSAQTLNNPTVNVLLHDNDAREERKNVMRQQNGPSSYADLLSNIAAVKIDNSNNPDTDVFLKIYNLDDFTSGVEAPLAILRARAGKVAEYACSIPYPGNFMGNLSYTVVTVPGTGGTNKPSKAVPLDMAVWIRT